MVGRLGYVSGNQCGPQEAEGMQRRPAIGGEMKKPEAEVPARFPARPVLPISAPLPDKHKTTHRHLFVNVLISHPRQTLQISGRHLCDCGTWAWAGGRRGVGVLVQWGASSMVALV